MLITLKPAFKLLRYLVGIFICAACAGNTICIAETISTKDNPNPQLIELTRSALKEIPLIRIGVAEARGNGHQAASLNLIKALRYRVGYEGEIEVIVADEVVSRVQTLLPSPGELTQLNVKVYAFSHRPSTHAELALLGADTGDKGSEQKFSPQNLYVDRVIILHPPHWGRSPTVLEANEPLDKPSEQLFSIRPYFPLLLADEAYGSLSGFLSKQLGHLENQVRKTDGLHEILMRLQAGSIEMMTAYGLGFGGPPKLVTLVRALERASKGHPELFKAPIVIPLLSQLNETEWNEFFQLLQSGSQSPRVTVVDVKDPSLKETLDSLQKRDLLIVKVGAVPQAVWHYLMRESSIPPLGSGSNAFNFFSQMGRPFLMSDARVVDAIWLEFQAANFRPGIPRALIVPPAACLASGRYRALSTWFIQAKTEGSKTRTAFMKFGAKVKSTPDRLCTALLSTTLAEGRIHRLTAMQALQALQLVFFADR